MISNRTRAIATLAGVFLLGMLAGGGALGLYLRGQMRDAQSMNDPAAFRGFIEQRLRLSQAQSDSLRDELGETYEDLASLRGAAAAEYGELIDTFSTRVAPQLDAEQRRLLGRLEAKMRKRFSHGAVRDTRRRGVLDSIDAGMLPQVGEPNPVDDTLSAQIPQVPTRDAVVPPKRVASPNIRPGRSILPAPDSTAPTVAANDAAGSGGRFPLPNLDTLRGRLALSPEQIGTIGEIVSGTRQKVRADHGQLRGFRRLQKEALRRNLLYMDARIEALLDQQQRLEYRALRRDAFSKLRSEKKGPRAPK